MNTWEYKLREFIGSADAFHALLTQERDQAWELGALLPAQNTNAAPSMAGSGVAAASRGTSSGTAMGICIIFKRQISTDSKSPAFFQ